MRYGGTGTTYLSPEKTDLVGQVHVTKWFTFAYCPIFPIRRERILPVERRGKYFSYSPIEQGKLSGASIGKTYLEALVRGLLLLTPFILIQWSDAFGIPKGFELYLGIGSIVWMIFLIWRWTGVEDRRWSAALQHPVHELLFPPGHKHRLALEKARDPAQP